MGIAIRDWQRSDFERIASLWLSAYARASLPDAPLRSDANRVLTEWLGDRFRDRRSLGYVGEREGEFAGFVLGRIGEWESDPPILKRRRIGLIDVVYVLEGHRRYGVASALVQFVIERARARGATALETSFETANEPATRLWLNLGFKLWIERAYRPIRSSSSND
jgi:GNAT superfamily N-acetyltransferase